VLGLGIAWLASLGVAWLLWQGLERHAWRRWLHLPGADAPALKT
jgi:hypothetical protein